MIMQNTEIQGLQYMIKYAYNGKRIKYPDDNEIVTVNGTAI